nr:immunoglobulin heavy chain junction region [Macaca mulatta]MOV36210.1 immunoglobulin heavy chain junction region [Macaca mulatta]MOV36833.1 immunoglobulin heavy chain junction region [Macaca mulatta]
CTTDALGSGFDFW